MQTLPRPPSKKNSRLRRIGAYLWKNKYLYFLLIPGLIHLFLFRYAPMYGIQIAFKDFSFKLGIADSPWNDFENFKTLFASKDFFRILSNSLLLSIMKLVFTFPIPIVLALLLNEIRLVPYKKVTQTIMYLPHFISWVVIGGIATAFLSADGGLINELIKVLGGKPINFLASESSFRTLIVITDIWKEAGWGTIIYLAALTGINPEYYEAARVDGATRLQQMWYITFPAISGTIMLLLIMRVGRILNNGFEQIYMLQNPMNMQVSDILETYTYRVGIYQANYSYGAAVGLFQSVIGFILVAITNTISKRLGQRTLY